MTKPTKYEKTLRVETVKQALIQGLTRYSILRNVSEKYSVTERTVENYIAEARKQLETELAAARPYMIGEHIAHRRDLRQRMRKAGDLHGELRVAQDEAKLLSLYEYKIKGWHDDIVAMLKNGEIDPSIVAAAYPDLAAQFFAMAGVKADD